MKTLFNSLLTILALTSCKKDDETKPTPVQPTSEADSVVIVSANITSDVTWYADSIYVLAGRIAVESGATLTIQAGTVVKGQAGTGENATALVVARGGKLMAMGTASAPIIMTSVADDIVSGQIISPSHLDPNMNGLWGGLVILGNATISADASPFQIEGIPASDANGLYGGTNDADNSGTIQYVSIRHGGSNIGEGNEINGITLGGVGSGTTIDHIEVVANQDDGIEVFGGTVNVSSILVWNSGDDAFDVDQDYLGTINNFIGIMGDETDHALELDGREGATDQGGFKMMNGSLKGWNEDGAHGGEFADLRSHAKCDLSNIYFFNFSIGADIELDNNEIAANYIAGDITFTALQFNFHLTDGDGANLQVNADVNFADVIADKGDDATDAFNGDYSFASKVDAPTVGADKAQFANWTWASAAGELADF